MFKNRIWRILAVTYFLQACSGLIGPRNLVVKDAVGFPESFETASKTGFAEGDETFTTGSWTLSDALIATSSNDAKSGFKSVRIRNSGFLRMNFDLQNIREVSLSHAVYFSDADTEWELWCSTDSGRQWFRIGTKQKTAGNLLKNASFRTEYNKARFEIRKITSDGSRLNIDDFLIKVAVDMNEDGKATRDDNLGMGNPSGAGTSSTNFLMKKVEYALSYNADRGTANWVSWHLSSAWKGTVSRTDVFKADDALPTNFYKVKPTDYLGTGFDRGHLCPSDDRDGSATNNEATFLMTNMAPQAPANNRGPWKDLEEYTRKVIETGFEAYVIAGVYGEWGTGSEGRRKYLADQNVTVPESFWKVIVFLPHGSNDQTRVKESTRIIAISMPNKQSVEGTSWGEYRLSIDDLEDQTGYNFLSNVPTEIQKILERKKDDGPTVKVSIAR